MENSLYMNGLDFKEDIRNKDPNQNAHRKVRFHIGWENAVNNIEYTIKTLENLTWENLGYRLGKLFGSTPSEQIDAIYDWSVQQLQSKEPGTS